jgi:predicted AAA+ superfamily ATPase
MCPPEFFLRTFPTDYQIEKCNNSPMKDLLYLLSHGLEGELHRLNPWWKGHASMPLPTMRRWAFSPALSRLKGGLTPAVVVRGPRQIGKTTMMKQMIEQLLQEGVSPARIFYIQFDEIPGLLEAETPILRLADWHEKTILGRTYNQAAKEGKPVFLFLDEVQNLPSWAPQLKLLVDSSAIRVMVTGSSALRIEQGRDSLAGRLNTLDMGPLLLREIMELRGFGRLDPYLPFNGLAPLKTKEFWMGLKREGEKHRRLRDQAFTAFSERGAYPIAHSRSERPWEELADVLNETVVRRAIQHDLRQGPRGAKRDEHLLEEVFRLSCRYAGQSPEQKYYLDEIKKSMNANIGWSRILNYLKFLDGTLLIRLIEPLELRLKRRRGVMKVTLCDHALRAAWLQEIIPLAPAALDRSPNQSDLAGHIAESVAGYFLKSITHLDVAHFPERGAEPEVDFIISIGDQRIPVEVKYQKSLRREDTFGLRRFVEKSVYNAPFGILVTREDASPFDDPRIINLPLSTLLLMR